MGCYRTLGTIYDWDTSGESVRCGRTGPPRSQVADRSCYHGGETGSKLKGLSHMIISMKLPHGSVPFKHSVVI